MNHRHLALSFVALAMALAACSTSDGSSTAKDPTALDAPAQGQGFQLKTDLFSVGPGEEVQNCYFFKIRDLARTGGLPENEPVNLHRIQMAQREGSHHMNLFRVKTIVDLDPAKGAVQVGKNGDGACFKSPNWADWPLVANTQEAGSVDWTFPDGVANVFQPDEWVMLQTHYVNASSQKTPGGGQVVVNFHTIPKSEVKAELGTIFATKQTIRVCKSDPTPTFNGTCRIQSNDPINVVAANGHFHSRGKTFEMFSWDGAATTRPADSARFYRSDTWADPPMLHDLHQTLPQNGGVFYTCGFQWVPPSDEIGGCAKLDELDKAKNPTLTPDCCYTFGGVVERNEHCNAFVYYWPKQANVTCN